MEGGATSGILLILIHDGVVPIKLVAIVLSLSLSLTNSRCLSRATLKHINGKTEEREITVGVVDRRKRQIREIKRGTKGERKT